MGWARPCRLLLVGLIALSLVQQQSAEVKAKEVRHIQCETCGMAIASAKSFIRINKFPERAAEKISDLIEHLCTPTDTEGSWIKNLDIVREDFDSQLSLEKMDGEYECGNECLTIKRACAKALVGNEDRLIELLMDWESDTVMKEEICKASCGLKIPKLDDWEDEMRKKVVWDEAKIDALKKEMDKIEDNMKQNPLYNKEDVDKIRNRGQLSDEASDSSDDEESLSADDDFDEF
eukprot:gnl/TRDRNA2_/TRDRNA2_83121_c0_seq2.p1 gnl/TRDRNA2_/TRDRNA2_83121_c0~~gnl/TRDRNA2_/TRDRNA2_83121_c0_seq2.p1  ORF type:complete len:256 (+),score=66.63 gnl/TRDRNA2_/TRDRNA2_83121_c0_seq2:67-768(+)